MTGGSLRDDLIKLNDSTMRNLFILLLLLLVANTGWSQSGCKNNWPANKEKAEEQLEIYSAALKQGNYRGAVPGIRWFLLNAPNWNTKLYVDGAEVYNKLAASEKNIATKQVLVDSLLWLYDERIKYCGDEAAVLNRKAMSAMIYNGQNKERTADVLALLDRVLDISGSGVSDNILDNYFKIVYANFSLLKNKTEDQVFAHYEKITNAIDVKITKYQQENKQSEAEKLKVSKANVENLFSKMVPADCDLVRKNLGPKFHSNPNDIATAKKIVELMRLGKCSNDSLYVEAGEAIYRLDPVKDFKLTKDLASKYSGIGKIGKATALAKQAVDLAKNNIEKAEAFVVMGDIQAKARQNNAARDAYKQATAADPQSREPWEKLGDLYASADDCKTNLVYLAAHEMYSKAGNPEKMSNMKSHFPSKEEIAALKMKKGGKTSTGCWVNESVVIETRD
jgi:tetratricopeptide (TPR) repeat protein